MGKTITTGLFIIALFIFVSAIPVRNQDNSGTFTITAGAPCHYNNIEITALSETVTLNDTIILKSGERRYFEHLEFRFEPNDELLLVEYNKDKSVRKVWVRKNDAPELQYSFHFKYGK